MGKMGRPRGCTMSSLPWQKRLLEALEEADHTMPCGPWSDLLEEYGGPEYHGDPPAASRPARVLSRPARIAVMAARVRAGRSPFHPLDLWRKRCPWLKVGAEARHNRRNGADMDGPVVALGG